MGRVASGIRVCKIYREEIKSKSNIGIIVRRSNLRLDADTLRIPIFEFTVKYFSMLNYHLPDGRQANPLAQLVEFVSENLYPS